MDLIIVSNGQRPSYNEDKFLGAPGPQIKELACLQPTGGGLSTVIWAQASTLYELPCPSRDVPFIPQQPALHQNDLPRLWSKLAETNIDRRLLHLIVKLHENTTIQEHPQDPRTGLCPKDSISFEYLWLLPGIGDFMLEEERGFQDLASIPKAPSPRTGLGPQDSISCLYLWLLQVVRDFMLEMERGFQGLELVVMSFELSLGIRNQTQVVEFVLLGFSGILYGHTYLALAFLAIYLVTVLGNLMIFTMIQLKSSLHSPMYYFLSHLSCLDMCLSSVTVPKIMVNLLLQQQTISYNQCMAQMFFLISFTAVEAALLGVMAYDRYTAICKPLHYSHLMNTKVCTVLAFATWVCGFLNSALHTALSTRLDFCGINQIHHIFCDLPPLMKMACNDAHINELALHIVGLFTGGAPLLFIIFSYISILSSILKIRSTTGKRKAFSTCASHLTVVFIYYGNALLNYQRPKAGYSLATGTLLSIMFCVITPMLNPLIYSLRNKEVKGALKKAVEIWRPSKHHHSLC
ncbi:olfactory receptor 5V1-like [Sphaerodactylus townsendi]|uniref:olfactory receptor 5V1-like n=1 Tax=Sphaerodactylus townsendi TaxID=933632 RepID=UPI0020266A0C|nr:olfactory receptor 5V1-like [Sphaerodactylus townsendi]